MTAIEQTVTSMPQTRVTFVKLGIHYNWLTDNTEKTCTLFTMDGHINGRTETHRYLHETRRPKKIIETT